VRRYLERVIAALSHLLNALTGGSPSNSFSARVGFEAHHGKRWAIRTARLIDGLLWSRNHCHEHAREEGLI